jgi:hypothetical protein
MYEAVTKETNISPLASQLSATLFITACRKATELEPLADYIVVFPNICN